MTGKASQRYCQGKGVLLICLMNSRVNRDQSRKQVAKSLGELQGRRSDSCILASAADVAELEISYNVHKLGSNRCKRQTKLAEGR